jgi:hypothetical protein
VELLIRLYDENQLRFPMQRLLARFQKIRVFQQNMPNVDTGVRQKCASSEFFPNKNKPRN